jgi:predicted DsbA family dithiol-disulfide isomerase
MLNEKIAKLKELDTTLENIDKARKEIEVERKEKLLELKYFNEQDKDLFLEQKRIYKNINKLEEEIAEEKGIKLKINKVEDFNVRKRLRDYKE